MSKWTIEQKLREIISGQELLTVRKDRKLWRVIIAETLKGKVYKRSVRMVLRYNWRLPIV